MIYVDTHIVVWLYADLVEKISTKALQKIQDESIFLSPMAILELQLLYDINRITVAAETIVHDLERRIGLVVCNASFVEIVAIGKNYTWTRDPFDRLIVASAALHNAELLTKDNTIREHYELAIWD